MNLTKILKNKLIVSYLAIAVTLSIFNLFIAYLFIPGNLREVKDIIIEHKLSTHEISNKLYTENVISFPTIFWIISKCYSFKNPLKSGEYRFTTKISPYQVLQILSSGKSIIHKFVIPEGATVSEIIGLINHEKRLFGEINYTIPEGFLMPSTYFFSYGDHKEHIINQMRKNMSAALDKVMVNLPANSAIRTRAEVLTLASIIEKETYLDEERPLVAAVFLNRLKLGMKLQADPTTIYAITNGKFKLNRPLSKKDLAIKLPHNTYYIFGLPPTPICCPGLKSLEAAAHPISSNALYFVISGTGGHSFSNNLAEHNKNIYKYKNQHNDSNLNINSE